MQSEHKEYSRSGELMGHLVKHQKHGVLGLLHSGSSAPSERQKAGSSLSSTSRIGRRELQSTPEQNALDHSGRLIRRGNRTLRKRQGFEEKDPQERGTRESRTTEPQKIDNKGFYWKDTSQGQKSRTQGRQSEETDKADLRGKVLVTTSHGKKEHDATKNAIAGKDQPPDEAPHAQTRRTPVRPLPASLTEQLYPHARQGSPPSSPSHPEPRRHRRSTGDLRMQVEHALPRLEIVYLNREPRSRAPGSHERPLRPLSSKARHGPPDMLTQLGLQMPRDLPHEMAPQRPHSARQEGGSPRMSRKAEFREELRRATHQFTHNAPDSREQVEAKQKLFELDNARFDHLPVDRDDFKR